MNILPGRLLLIDLPAQIRQNLIPFGQMLLEVLDLLADGLDIFAQALEVLPFFGSAGPFAQLAEFALLVLEHLQGFLLDQGPVGPAVGVAARAQPAAFLSGPIRRLELSL